MGERKKRKNTTKMIVSSYDTLQNTNELSIDMNDDSHDTKLTTVSELILTNSLKEELVFKRPKTRGLEAKNYREVSFSNLNQKRGQLINTAMPFLQQTVTINQIKKAAPNGLFTTSADFSSLSKFTDGTYTTMVRSAKNELIEHQGFTQLDSVIGKNPLVAVNVGVQAMAAISGQYYLHEITSQLEDISGKLDELIAYHNEEKIGVLLTVRERLLKITSKKFPDEHDIEEIRALLGDCLDVFYEYKTRLSRQQEELAFFESKKKLAKNRLTALDEKIETINFTIKVIYLADQSSLQAELSEIVVRMKLGHSTVKIQELVTQMQKRYEESFYSNVKEFIDGKYKPLVRKLYQKLGGKYLAKHPDRLNHSVRFAELEKSDLKIGVLVQQLIANQNKKQEILYIPGENLSPQRVFVEVSEN